jgi:hypothetical protein
MSESFSRVYGGEAGQGKIPVLWEGMKYLPISMTLKDAEFLDSRKFSVAEIARWFGVPPHMVGDVERSTSWGTGIEQQGLHFLIYSLLPWIELIEQSIRFTLVVQPEKFYPKMNVNAILRMDAKTQADVFGMLIDKGVLNPNECRELLERNPREGGDEYVDVAKEPEPVPQQQIPPPMEPMDEPDEPDDDMAEQARALDVARTLAVSRATEILDEEARCLTKLAQTHAKDPAAWQASAKRFYGHFSGCVAEAMACGKVAAKGWCDARRGLACSGGLAALTNGQREAAQAALVALSLSHIPKEGAPECSR